MNKEVMMESRPYDKAKKWDNRFLWHVGGFYLFQGFYFTALGLYKDTFLVERGMTPGTFAVIAAILILPNYLKMLLILLSDRVPVRGFRRKPYILLGAVLYVPCFLGLIYTHNENAITGGWVFFIILTGWVWVLVDGTLDALTVDITPEDRMGRLQGSAWGARGLGGVLGSLVIMIVGAKYGWEISLVIMGVCAVVQAIFGLSIKEPMIQKENLPEFRSIFRETFARRDVQSGLLFTVIAMATTAPYMFFIPMFGKGGIVGLEKTQLGIAYALAMVGTFIGAMISGWVSDRIGARKTFIITAVMFWAGVLLFIPLNSETSYSYSLVAIELFGINIGAFMTPTNRISMELSETVVRDKPGIEGFMFSTFSSISNFGTAVVGGMVVALGSDILNLKLTYAFFLIIPLTLLSIFLLRYVDPWVPEGEKE